jgi:hypothetical protein
VGSSEDLQSFELRKDVSDLCERLRKAKAANRDRRTVERALHAAPQPYSISFGPDCEGEEERIFRTSGSVTSPSGRAP